MSNPGTVNDYESKKIALGKHFEGKAGIVGVGIGVDSLNVYIEDETIISGLPKMFQGVNLTPVVVGKISTE